jgi:small GTP-binding protein
MSLVNYASKEVTLKIVYYGPGLSGKTTNLQYLHTKIPQENKGKLLSLATESDRTLFFDFMPMTLGKIGDFTIKFQLYTVPGQVRYNATRKLVLKGADAVVFVADSQETLREQNIESYQNMLDNLSANNLDPEEIPVVFQYNKRDLDDIMSEDDLNKTLNVAGHETINAEAVNGTGVNETFRLVTHLLLKQFAVKHKIGLAQPSPAATPPQHPRPVSAPAQQPSPQQMAPPVREIPEAPETMPETTQDETLPTVEVVPETPTAQMEKPTATEESTPEESTSDEMYDESHFAPREMPSIDELPSVMDNPLETAEAATGELSATINEIASKLKESQVEVWLEKLIYSSDTVKHTVSELVSELKESRKNQEQMIDLLKRIENALRLKPKTPKQS